MRRDEDRLQMNCVRLTTLIYPWVAGCFWHTPNGGSRSAREGARFKAMGVLAGVADLFIALPSSRHIGLFIEFKAQKGRQSAEQKVFQERMEAIGYRYEVVRSVNQYHTVITGYLADVAPAIKNALKEIEA